MKVLHLASMLMEYFPEGAITLIAKGNIEFMHLLNEETLLPSNR